MPRRSPHFSRPVYEGLPWVYITTGLAALAVSYLAASHVVPSLLLGLGGFAGVLLGAVLLLRRRDYRALRERYGDPGSLGGDDPGPPS